LLAPRVFSRHTRLLALVWMGWVVPAAATGQTLEDFDVAEGQAILIGVAVDRTTGTPLVGAAVYFVESDASAVSDSLGRFAIGPVNVGLYRVSFYHQRLIELAVSAAPMYLVDLTRTGIVRADIYIPRGAELEKLQGLDLPDVEPIILDAIVVVGDRAEARRNIRERSGANIATLERDEIELRVREARHIGDLLSGFTSLRITSPKGGVLCIQSRRSAAIRSAGASRCPSPVAVYLDGVPLADPEFALLQIPPRDIERIEFLNGIIAGARYGLNAGNGVLIVETRRPR